MNSPFVSTIIPTYNRARLLPETIRSVQAQTFANWELLIVDDRSTDDTAALVDRLAAEDPRIHRIPNEHAKGPSGARNQGLDAARGKYVAYLDSDDQWEPFHLERMIYYLEKYPDSIDVMNANMVRRQRSTGDVYDDHLLDLSELEFDKIEDALVLRGPGVFDTQLRKRVLLPHTMVGKREALAAVRWDEDLAAATDCMYCVRLVHSGVQIGHLQEYHAVYWVHDENLTNCGKAHSPERMTRVAEAFALYLERVLAEFPLSASQRTFVERRLASGYFWRIGYNCYLAMDDYRQARQWFRRGMYLRPFRPEYWKAYAGTYAKQFADYLRGNRDGA